MNEWDLIRAIAVGFPRSPQQLNGLFECDAELLEIGGTTWAFTMDQFSPGEDMFTDNHAEALGANLAVCTLSDLYAAGAKPAFFFQGITLPKAADSDFAAGLSNGIRKVLSRAGCFLCGGDIDIAEEWRFTGFAMGPATNNKPIKRIVAEENQSIWVTGKLGDANLAVLQKSHTPLFELRCVEADAIHPYARACIDTSDGFINALSWLYKLRPSMRFEVRLEQIPFADGVVETASKYAIPSESFLLGSAGEYELLFITDENLPPHATAIINSVGATRIGTVRPGKQEAGVFFLKQDKSINFPESGPPCPREIADRNSYIAKVIEMSKILFVK